MISMSPRLLFFGLTIMALTTIGRESSLNTFSAMLAQPAERIRIWQTKLSVLAVAFLIVFLVWLGSIWNRALRNSSVDADDRGRFLQPFHRHLPDCHRNVHRRAVDDAVASPDRGCVLAHAARAGGAGRIHRWVCRRKPFHQHFHCRSLRRSLEFTRLADFYSRVGCFSAHRTWAGRAGPLCCQNGKFSQARKTRFQPEAGNRYSPCSRRNCNCIRSP